MGKFKTKTIRGKEYSKKAFPSYQYRGKLKFIVGGIDDHHIDIYTTETDKELFIKGIGELITDKVDSFELIHWTTRESDEAISIFLDSFELEDEN